MDSITRWLEELGLGEYAPLFAENAIDLEVLAELTEADLEKIGVKLGHRKRILKAITASLDEGLGRSRTSADTIAADTTTGDAERRQLTVMFCDLIGSTELSQKLDPEDLRDVMRVYQDAVKQSIERYDGYVARYMGDGVLCYFGYPQAHEDDAERAVRAGLELAEHMPALNDKVGSDKGVTLAVRVGLATGPVVVGDLIGEGASQESAVVGETPNVAARMESLAEADSVFISESTRRLVGAAFELEDKGTRSLKGIAEPVRVFRAVRAADIDSRFAAAHGAGLAPLVAREKEMNVLLRCWEQARRGEGRSVLISGGPGIGKSRVVEALRQRLSGEEHIRVQYQCSPYHTNSAFHPFVAQLQRAAGFRRADGVEEKLEKLETLIGDGAKEDEKMAPLLAAMLSLPVDGYPSLDMVPKVQKQRTCEALAARLLAAAGERPVLLIFEDAHWADPTTLEALGVIREACRAAPVLVVMTGRPEFDPPSGADERFTHLSLDRLDRQQAAALVSGVTGGRSMPAAVLEEILDRTDGVPLFVEELTRVVLEAGLLQDGAEGYVLQGPTRPLAIPATLHDSLLARLDHLSEAKELAQVAACIGREFPYDLLASVTTLSDAELGTGLGQLGEAELIFTRGSPPDAVYTFKHALLRDAAYDSMLRQRRRSIHARIAEVMEERATDHSAEDLTVLAQHFEGAENWSRSFDCLCSAAEQSTANHALDEAASLYRKALEFTEKPEIACQQDRVFAVHKNLANVLFTKGHFDESRRQGICMLEFARRSGGAEWEGAALVNLATSTMWAEDFDETSRLGSQVAAMGEDSGNASLVAGGKMITGLIHGLTGRLEDSGTDLERSVGISRDIGDNTYLAPALFMVAMLENWKGSFDAAISMAASGQRIADEQKQLAWFIRCKWTVGTALVAKGSYDEALKVLREGLAVAEKVGDVAYVPRYMNTIGWLFNECHGYEAGADLNRRAVELDEHDSHATGVERSMFSTLNWVDALIELDDLEGAGELLKHADGVVRNPKTHDWMKWRYTIHALCTMAEYWNRRGEPDKAARYVSECLQVASAKDSRKYVAMGKRNLALVAMHRQDLEAAETALLSAEEIVEGIGHPNELWKARAALSELYKRRGDERKRALYRNKACEVLDGVREALVDDELRAHYGSSSVARRMIEEAP